MGITTQVPSTVKRILELAKRKNPAGTDWMYRYDEIAEQIGGDLNQGNISAICRAHNFRRVGKRHYTNGHTLSPETIEAKIAELQQKLEQARNMPVAEFADDDVEADVVVIKNCTVNTPLPLVIRAIKRLFEGGE